MVAAVDFTSNTSSSVDKMDTSNVAPPGSKIKTFLSIPTFLSDPQAMAVAIGLSIILRILSPAIVQAFFVA